MCCSGSEHLFIFHTTLLFHGSFPKSVSSCVLCCGTFLGEDLSPLTRVQFDYVVFCIRIISKKTSLVVLLKGYCVAGWDVDIYVISGYSSFADTFQICFGVGFMMQMD